MPSATDPEPRAPEPRRRRSGCPGCGAATVVAHAPFCSRGCRDRDLLLWFGEAHRIPGRPAATDDDDG